MWMCGTPYPSDTGTGPSKRNLPERSVRTLPRPPGRNRSALPATKRRERPRRVCSRSAGRVPEGRGLCRSSPDAALRRPPAGKDQLHRSASADTRRMSLKPRARGCQLALRPPPGTQAVGASQSRIALLVSTALPLLGPARSREVQGSGESQRFEMRPPDHPPCDFPRERGTGHEWPLFSAPWPEAAETSGVRPRPFTLFRCCDATPVEQRSQPGASRGSRRRPSRERHAASKQRQLTQSQRSRRVGALLRRGRT